MNIKINNLSKSYGEKHVLKNIMFDDEVKTLALIGRSGGGKSTLLRTLGGLITDYTGEAFLDNRHVEDSELYRKEIGFVFQQGGLFQHLTALENITLPLTLVHGVSQIEADAIGMALLERFGLSAEAHKLPKQLSGGQQQRVAIARAIAPKPKVLLLDEPTSALDPEYTTEVLDMINELKEDGISFIIATHEIGFARHACEKVAFLHNGVVLEYGVSEDIFKQPKTEELQKFLSKLLGWNV